MWLGSHTPWPHVDDLTDTMCAERLFVAGERQRVIQVEGRRAGPGFRHRLLELGAIRFERRCRRGQRVGAHQHHAIGCGDGFEIGSGFLPRQVHQRAAAIRGRRHPGRGIEDQHMIAGHCQRSSQP